MTDPRTKGHAFERLIASKERARFPQLGVIKRTIQTRGGRQEGADVVGLPHIWQECQHANHDTRLEKLEQAERDSAGTLLIPIAITRRTRSRELLVTLRMHSLEDLLGRLGTRSQAGANLPVMITFEQFLDLYEQRFLSSERPIRRVKRRSDA